MTKYRVDDRIQGRRQVKNSGVDTHGERGEREPTTIGADFMGPEGLEPSQYFGPGAHPANEPPPQ